MSEISSHLNDKGEARMVDVSAKDVTVRVARAEGFVAISADVIALLRRGDLPKGDALAVARLAGIQAAKRTPDLIPLCHPIAIHAVDIELEILEKGVSIKAEVRTADRTGVEMEALTSVAVAGLALIDMIKGKDRGAHITDVRVTHKSGGKSGEWNRE
ncbi:MAG: cyclic pyranopterin monophosphate synthase MoaC [Actinomycetes bacterium]